MTTYAVIMAGGSGTRFWPLSRRALPKQLLPLWAGRTLLELTVERLAPLAPLDRLLIVAGGHLAESIARTLPDLPERNLLVEPSARNTLPCVALAVAAVHARDPDAVLGVFSADHFVRDQAAFTAACQVGVQAARAGQIATLGLQPTRPETGFGYLRFGAEVFAGARRVEAFVEKPHAAAAERYLTEGSYLWNAGIFFFTPATFLDELLRQRPSLEEPMARLRSAVASEDRVMLAEAFAQLDATSLDYGIMEGARDVVVVPADIGWNDVGHWSALHDVLEPDEGDNVVLGDVLTFESRGCVVVGQGGEGKVVVVLGMDDTVVVDTPTAMLVMPRSMAQRVKDVVALLQERGREEVL